MPALSWDNVGDRVYHTGISKGAIYLQDGRSVPWNGLTSVTETLGSATKPVYFDGQKVSDLKEAGTFKGTIKAVTFPDELMELTGFGIVSAGIHLGEQSAQTFNMTYQTRLGTDMDPEAGYNIHVLYNVTAVPSPATHNTLSDSTNLSQFSWDITTVPQEVNGFQPTSHIVINSRKANPTLLSDIELMFYGSTNANPVFPSFDDFMELLLGYYLIEIIDNKDGTWTALGRGGFISVDEFQEFEIDGIDATYSDAETYQASSTLP